MSIWEDLGKSHCSRGPGGTAPVLRVGKEMLPLAFSFLMASHPPTAAAAQHVPEQQLAAPVYPFTPKSSPFGGSQHGGIHPTTRAAIPSRRLSLLNRDAPSLTPGIAAPGILRKNQHFGQELSV